MIIHDLEYLFTSEFVVLTRAARLDSARERLRQ
jgi:hypothetical protein